MYEIKNNFLTMEISEDSSNNDNEDVFILVGKAKNNHSYLDFDIKEIKLNFLGSLGVVSLDGLVDLIVPNMEVIF